MAAKGAKPKAAISYSNTKEWSEGYGGGGWKPTAYTLPAGVEAFRFTEAKNYRIDIMPFRVGAGNPQADEGTVHWERTYYTHGGLGAEGMDHYTCLQQTFGKKCPICEEYVKRKRAGASKEELGDLRPKTRQLFVFFVHSEHEKGYQVYEASHYRGFGELLKAKLDAQDEDSPYLDFFHLEDGMTLVVKAAEDSYAGKKFFKPANIEMVPRKEQFDVAVLDDIPCLDELPKELSYAALKAVFEGEVSSSEGEEPGNEETEGAGEEGQQEEEAPKPKPKTKPPAAPAKPPAKKVAVVEEEEPEPEPEPEEEEAAEGEEIVIGDRVRHEDLGVCEVVNVSPDGSSIRLRDEDGTVHRAIDPSTVVKEEEEPEEEEAPPPKPKAGVKKPAPKAVVEEEEPAEEEEEAPPPKPKPKTAAPGVKPFKKPAPPPDEEEVEEDLDFEAEEEAAPPPKPKVKVGGPPAKKPGK